MNDLLRDSLDDFGQGLLDAGEMDGPEPGARDALLASLVTGAAIAGAAGATATKVAFGKGLAITIAKWTLIGTVAVAGAGFVAVRSAEPGPVPVRALAPATRPLPVVARPPSSAEIPPSPADQPPVAERPRVTVARLAAPVAEAPVETEAPAEVKAPEAESRAARMLAEQVTMLDRVRASLRRKDHADAIAVLDDYDRRFGPAAALGPEARRLRARAEALQER